MSRRERSKVEESLSPNLIPMIDIMFLLLLFFMLSADMTQRRTEEVALPRASEARPEDPVARADEIVNVHHRTAPGTTCAVHENGGVCRDEDHWGWAVLGREYTSDALGAELRDVAKSRAEADVDAVAGKRLSAAKVLVRADASAPYGDVQKVIEACGRATIHEVEVAAAMPARR